MFASSLHASRTLPGVLLVAFLALMASYIANLPALLNLNISPLILGILLGVLLGNTCRPNPQDAWHAGLVFSTKFILRLGIVLYGFRLSFQNVHEVGYAVIFVCCAMVLSTLLLGYLLGTKLLKLDRDTTILICAGHSICGAAAVLATESILKPEQHKTSVAVASVVIFGSIAMFLYPLLYKSGVLNLAPQDMGVYLGASLQEVAHVVAAGNAIGEQTANTAVISKMLRVMLLAPFLIMLTVYLARACQSKLNSSGSLEEAVGKVNLACFPWFALGFIAVVGLNSVFQLPTSSIGLLHSLDTFLLTMAMTALGLETRIEKFKGIGLQPFYLSALLFVWLLVGGYSMTQIAMLY